MLTISSSSSVQFLREMSSRGYQPTCISRFHKVNWTFPANYSAILPTERTNYMYFTKAMVSNAFPKYKGPRERMHLSVENLHSSSL